ncbi:MAG: alpha/beta hydrolase [Erythrobacter sp.]
MTTRLAAAFALLFAACAVPAAAQMDPAELVEKGPLSIASSYTVQSEFLGGERIVTVRLPAEYEAEPERHFPVVYLLDGGPEQDFIHIAGIAQSREMNYSFEPFILVGIQSVNRRHELSPPVADPEPYEAVLGATPGGSQDYRNFLRVELIPAIQERYRTNSHNAIIGESLAALFIIETLLEEPTLFTDYIAISPSLWWEEMKHSREAPKYFERYEASYRRLYLTVANEGDWHREGTERFVAALRDHAPEGLKWTFVDAGESETHGTLFHPMALDAFRALYPTPGREYKSYPLIGGPSVGERTAEEEARLDTECSTANSLPIAPGAAALGRETLYYRCLLYELGPLPREGNLPG